MNGFAIGGLEILFFMLISGSLKFFFNSLRSINSVCYYWLCMTVLTGFWEATYLTNYNEVVTMAVGLIKNDTHVWTNEYDFSYVLPWKLAKIFYAEYGAWADREYMSVVDPWSHTIEGTHMLFCAVFAFFGLLAGFEKKTLKSVIAVAMAMAFQLMNSVLYMIEYGIQTQDTTSVNYNTSDFPLGVVMLDRPFMYVNVFWLIMPTFVIFFELCNLTILNEPVGYRNTQQRDGYTYYPMTNQDSKLQMGDSGDDTPPTYTETELEGQSSEDRKTTLPSEKMNSSSEITM